MLVEVYLKDKKIGFFLTNYIGDIKEGKLVRVEDKNYVVIEGILDPTVKKVILNVKTVEDKFTNY